MYKAGWANTSLYVINGLAMVLAFFGCRIAWGYTESVVLVMDIVKERYVPGTAFPKGATIGYCIAAVVMNRWVVATQGRESQEHSPDRC